MTTELISRIIGLIVLALLGIWEGYALPGQVHASGIEELIPSHILTLPPYLFAIILGIISGAVGFALTPKAVVKPLTALGNKLIQVPAQKLVAGLLGLLCGLIVASLATFPFSKLPVPLSQVIPPVFAILFGYLGAAVFMMRSQDLFSFVRNPFSSRFSTANTISKGDASGQMEEMENDQRPILMDTSVIIDGRISDVARTGFLIGVFLIPRFVLNELQYIADSPDSLRRQRGRRGMEIIAQLQKNPAMPVRISDIDVEGVRDVDEKLVVLARQLRCPILTNDYNLNRVAELQGVVVLNINELANAVKSVLLPGELLSVKIIQEGKESGQGVGYLDDGTMVVVEDGRNLLLKKQEATVVVTKVLQTAAGRMIFAKQMD
ncbi:MAG: PIN domain-containing protein [Chloroflexota bacterium]